MDAFRGREMSDILLWKVLHSSITGTTEKYDYNFTYKDAFVGSTCVIYYLFIYTIALLNS